MHSVLTLLTITLFAVILSIAPYATALDTEGLVGAWLFRRRQRGSRYRFL